MAQEKQVVPTAGGDPAAYGHAGPLDSTKTAGDGIMSSTAAGRDSSACARYHAVQLARSHSRTANWTSITISSSRNDSKNARPGMRSHKENPTASVNQAATLMRKYIHSNVPSAFQVVDHARNVFFHMLRSFFAAV